MLLPEMLVIASSYGVRDGINQKRNVRSFLL
jgi:hypothetical protein